jgi:hypothetical protein
MYHKIDIVVLSSVMLLKVDCNHLNGLDNQKYFVKICYS